ncbi:MAG: hypothetical protein A4E20_10895 [Nitrospira sp. SG-bin2]|uniref:hypothetical protein n=1 Tax=Nitrospira cf. moscoviensis SBR1015 TaxID=96242 RepID=UPI000A0E6624|nr:hypothetical protein [Nitrospira cf. moscoviensis SBR1015]OQW34519.1 MAG: hypothetical protein A4E20_10895 [Nitrospira sp. SG-bin2]
MTRVPTGSFDAAAIITASTAPTMGNLNRYNAASGALTPTLPALSGLNEGSGCVVAKAFTDTTLNSVTFTRAGSDTFTDGQTSFALIKPGSWVALQVITVSATKYWAIVGAGELYPRGGLSAISAQVARTNTTSAIDVVTATLPVASLFVGSTYRVVLDGTIQTSNAASSSLTFTPYIQNTALAQTAVMASTGTANAASAFHLEFLITVRSTGASGTALAKPRGVINLATTGLTHLVNTSASTTTIDTTSAAASTALKVTAQWGATNASNSLLVDFASIERVI